MNEHSVGSRRLVRSLLWTTAISGASAGILIVPASAWSQSAGGTAANSGQLEEIVVAATRQEQSHSRVPVSVAAYTQAKLDQQGIKSVADLERQTPGMRFTPGTNTVAIRGISSTAGQATTGVYIDDTPFQLLNVGIQTSNALPAIFDLERMEILCDPQGTLFGAGAVGGVVRYITPQPSFTRYSTYGRAEAEITQGGAASYEFGFATGGSCRSLRPSMTLAPCG